MLKKKVLFISRDRTLLRVSKGAKRADSLDRLELLPKVISSLTTLKKKFNFELVMVTNQEGLGTDEFPEDKFWRVQNKLLQILENEDVVFDAIFIDRSFESENIPSRKPNSGMLQGYSKELYNLSQSYVIGDSVGDIELAENLGIKSIYLSENNTRDAISWDEIVEIITNEKKYSFVKFKNEVSEIDVKLVISAESKFNINSSNQFFNHLIQQISIVTKCNLIIEIKKGFFVDGHYTIESVGMALGKAYHEILTSFDRSLSAGFNFVEEDAEANVTLNFNTKSHINWDVNFNRNYIGDIPTEMFYQFFKSFTLGAECTIHVSSTSENEHNKIEAIFKSFAFALKMAFDNASDPK